MGIPLTFQAIPESSGLLALLRTNRRIGTLFADLYSMGGGPFTWSRLDELDEILQNLVGRGVLRSIDEARGAFAELNAEWNSALASNPALEGRRAFLDKTQHELNERITQRLTATGEEPSAELISDLFHGEDKLRNWSSDGYDPLRLISAARVKAIAGLLGRLDENSIFHDDEEDWLGEDYRGLRQLCFEAAIRGESIIVGS
jgi:hypothetical protein